MEAEYPVNKAASVPGPGASLADLFEQQVSAQPDAGALRFEDVRLTYAELDRRANQLAHLLVEEGVRPRDIVALALPRSVEAIVAQLAVAKAGATFLPVDPLYPAERITFMLRDARPVRVLTTAAVGVSLPGVTPVTVLDAPRTVDDLGRRPKTALAVRRGAQAPAYVIYTSGSTGVPKGVVVPHTGIPSLVETHRRRLAAGPGSRVLQFASPSFDASVWEVCMALLTGGTLVCAPADRLLPGPALADLIAEHDVTHVTLPPSALAVLPPDALPSVSVLVVAGEACAPDLVRRWAGGRTMVNAYGPTESTVCATMSRPLSPDGDAAPIGLPIVGTRVYVLDPELTPVEDGAIGELYIAGLGLADGYLNRREITDAVFLPDPFGSPGDRMYRSGDLVRRGPDGQLDFVGRADDQVKINGFRVEPGEVEAALTAHPGLAHAAVVVRETAPGKPRLVAYVVPAGEPVTAVRLRDDLRRRLPDYLVPAAFVVVDRLPLTPNGKLDRRALPDVPVRSEGDDRFLAAATPIEKLLVGIYGEVLGLPEVGAEDDFFQLGGDSLLTIQVLARIREDLGVDLSPRAMFDRPTAAAMAELVAAQEPSGQAASPGEDTDAVRPAERTGALPLSYAQQALWFMAEFAPESYEYNLGTGLRLTGELDEAALLRALAGLVERHEALRTTFEMAGDQPVQVVHPPRTPMVTLADLRSEPDPAAELDARATADLTRPFDLAVGPLVRPSLFRTADDEHVLLLTVHHIVLDRWSVGVLIRELIEFYEAELHGSEPALPPVTLQYADFAVWQREHLTDDALADSLSHWRRTLDGVNPLELPIDRPRPRVRTWAGGAERFHLPAQKVARLRELSHRHGSTLFMSLTAVVDVLLARLSGSSDVAFATVVAGRDRAETEHIVGSFVNTVVLRSRVDGSVPFEQLLAGVKETVLEAFVHQQVPFERVVDEVAPVRDPSRYPLAQVLVVLHRALVEEAHVGGELSVTGYDLPRRSSMFDLTVEFVERGDDLTVWLGYNTDLFEADTVRRLAGMLFRLLDAVLEDPTQTVSALPMLSAAEEHRVLTEFNDTDVEYPSDKCVHELFEEQVRLRPDAVAVIAGQDRITYAELDRRANRIAHALRGLGIGPDVPVGLCVRRGWRMVAGMLGILKAGGAYVPLDPAYPADRLTFMLADTAAPVLLTEEELTGLFGDETAPTVVLLDTGWDTLAEHPDTTPENLTTPDDLAYIMYTSGSTGVPKGVAAPHRATVRTFFSSGLMISGPDEVVPQCLSMSWDGLSAELWSVLLHGGTSVLYPNQPTDAEVLAGLVREHCVTTLCMPPSLLNAFVDAFPDELRSVRQVITGGDVASPFHIAKALRHAPHLRLVNCYGPVESTVAATWYEMPAGYDGTSPVPIGRPLGNTVVYVVDEGLNPVPVGVAGELLIGG
ncbi:amino acid adenylation domain-containing protein, partial [Micromonospora siamensis]